MDMTNHTCLRCGHTWAPRTDKKTRAVPPRCKSPMWDKPRNEKYMRRGER
jgi:hypothetical protein